MCKCNPQIKTPYCGAIGCEWPEQEVGKISEVKFREFKIIKEYISYNSLTGEIYWVKSPSNRIKEGKINNKNEKGYVHFKLKRKTYLAHRVAWLIYYGYWPIKHIDHINGIKDDNRISNLRDVSAMENCSNRFYHRKGKLVGTTFLKKRNKWMAQIQIKGSNKKYIGVFKTETEAHEAYLKAKKDICGKI